MTYVLHFYHTTLATTLPMALATAYSQRPKFFIAKHSTTALGENCVYRPTLRRLHPVSVAQVFFLSELNGNHTWATVFTEIVY